jgi:hypothetical protein
MVIMNGETKVAQYGQWDGYPAGQGVTILKFLKNNNLKKFRNKLESVSFFTKEQEEELEGMSDKELFKKYPHINRNMGAEILTEIYKGNAKKLINSEGFAIDGLFCEWAYVVDLDKNIFEVYRGFWQKELTKKDRFYSDGYNSGGYYPVKLLKTYHFDENKRFLIAEKTVLDKRIGLPLIEEFVEEIKQLDKEDDD